MQLIQDLIAELAAGKYENFCRMSVVDLEFLFNLVGPTIVKQDTPLRQAVSAKERLLVTLRFLASGDSYQSLSYIFRISPQLIGRIVPEVCAALNVALRDEIQVNIFITIQIQIESSECMLQNVEKSTFDLKRLLR
ncbi:hypothetical protein V9T40_007191 [Parthenolecanium corni]|uniref:Nuclease HARBI1 n=1 Tax=Parthenolecanium corni TaxID=536013 RepID=A0AAN9U4Q7_9HEMI